MRERLSICFQYISIMRMQNLKLLLFMLIPLGCFHFAFLLGIQPFRLIDPAVDIRACSKIMLINEYNRALQGFLFTFFAWAKKIFNAQIN